MSPTAENKMDSEEEPSFVRIPGEEVVISGISGIFPSSKSVQEFSDNLYNKVNMVKTEKPCWEFDHPEAPQYVGKAEGLKKFDAQFFRIHYLQANTMEPMSRKILEHAFSAIYDSGTNPVQLRGKKVGVFIGTAFSESERVILYQNIQRNGFGVPGVNRSMYANRVSYWIDGKGPSYALDQACVSSSTCLEQACKSISSGECDAAIVGGCNLCMHPYMTLHFRRAGLASFDGKTRCFDKNGDGCARSDTVAVLFLQKAKDAKRIYSEVYHTKSTFSPSKGENKMLPLRETQDLEQVFNDFYSEIDVSPKDVEYIEANGAAIPIADSNEITAIGQVFTKEKPIKIGCVKSNMGSSEPASGLCAITKICLAYQNGKLPGNLHYNEPLDIPAIRDKKVQVLTDNTDFNRGFAAINAFSYGGANIHILLKGRYKQKNTERYKTHIPRLVLVSGRSDDCLKNVLNKLSANPIDPEHIGLLHSIHEFEIFGHMSRAYSILDTNEKKETVSLSQSTEYYPGNTRPVWFVYSGMGSQWNTMGAQLMRIPIFAAAIEKCHKVLKPKGIDIVRILTDPDKTIFDNILHSFVGIAAVQIGLTDILRELGIVPDNIIGHSVGELGCAYADGCFTREEMILSAYSRGLVSLQTDFIRGSMAAVGMGYKDILPICPAGIEVACHNSPISSTISGPEDIMKQFITELKNKNIFAKEVPCSNIAYHSKYIADAGPSLLKYLKDVIKDPKARSEKWVSTSVPQDEWDQVKAKYSSAEYHTNNLLNPVLFEETAKLIPSDALVIEVAPHALLQSIMTRSWSGCVFIPLTKRGIEDSVLFFLEAIGKLYQAGLYPKVSVLYPKIEYPVSTETPLLSHYVEWEHSEDWPQGIYEPKKLKMGTVRDFVMSIYDEDYKYFKGHVRNGRNVYPESAILVLVWETLAMYLDVKYKEMSVLFENVKFHGEAIIKPELSLKLEIMIMKGNNRFEVTYENAVIISGFVYKLEVNKEDFEYIKKDVDENDTVLNTEDIYTVMGLRGYCYKNEFQSIHSAWSNCYKAYIKWNDDWITYLDSLFQLNALANEYDGISTPFLIDKLSIDIQSHSIAELNDKPMMPFFYAQIDNRYECTRSGGVTIKGLVLKDELVKIENRPNILSQTFIPHISKINAPIRNVIEMNLQLVSENTVDKNILVVDHVFEKSSSLVDLIIEVADQNLTQDISIELIEALTDKAIYSQPQLEKAHLVITDNILADEKKMNKIEPKISEHAFILTMENKTPNIRENKNFAVITMTPVQNKTVVLLRKIDYNHVKNVIYMHIVQDQKFLWIPQLQSELEKSKTVVLVSERQPFCGLLGMIKNLRTKYGNKISVVVVDDYQVPLFDRNLNIFKSQLEQNLAINILKKGQWGGYYNISSTASTKVENVRLAWSSPNDLDSLKWVENPTASSSHVQVFFAGPSENDIHSTRKNLDHQFGMDFSGITNRGDRVMGVVSTGGTIASSVEADTEFLWPVPPHWTLEDAATVPLSYIQAYYCLAIRGKIEQGSTILVNCGASALAQAIIYISISLNCDIYVLVDDVKQKEFLMRMFPSLDEKNINKTTDMILSKMNSSNNFLRNGCDVVINGVEGSLCKINARCISLDGKFLDFTQYNIRNNVDFGMNFLTNSRNYICVQLRSIFNQENAHEKKILKELVTEGIARGIVNPLSRVVYPPSDVSRAFRLFSSNKNKGKVLISLRNSDFLGEHLDITPKMQYSTNASYIVITNDTVLGIELADRLVKHGARNLILHFRQNSITGYCYTRFKSWNKFNVSIRVSSENLQSENGCSNLIREGTKVGSVHGVFVVHAFDDGGVNSYSPDDVRTRYTNTAAVVANLDRASKHLCNELKHFVVLNYAIRTDIDEYIASAIDSICRCRNDIGLPALVLRTEQVAELYHQTEYEYSKTEYPLLSAVLNTLETSLKLNHKSAAILNLKKKKNTLAFVDRLSRIIGVKNIYEIDENLSLNDLLLSHTVIEEVNVAIKDTYQETYPIETLGRLTIKELKNKGHKVANDKASTDIGLSAFFTYIDSDECAAAEPIVTMTSLYTIKDEEALDPKASYVMLVPGFEGHHQIFTTVAERLKVQALALQLAPDFSNDSVSQLAANIAKYVRNRLELKSKFYLFGYSFGVNVALELAKLFEMEGHVGVVYCLDSSPDALRAQLDAYLGHLSDSLLQDSIIAHMYTLMTGHDSALLSQLLPHQHDWRDKVELCVNELRALAKYSHQYKRCILNSAYKRIMLAREYEPDFTLQSELVLIKGVLHPNMDVSTLADDFNLSKYTNKPVQVFNIESDHASAYRDCRVSNIVNFININTLLEPKLLDEFKNKNLCSMYYAETMKTW